MGTSKPWALPVICALLGVTGGLVAVAMASGARANDSEARLIEVRIAGLTKVVETVATQVNKIDEKLDRLCVAVARLEPKTKKDK